MQPFRIYVPGKTIPVFNTSVDLNVDSSGNISFPSNIVSVTAYLRYRLPMVKYGSLAGQYHAIVKSMPGILNITFKINGSNELQNQFECAFPVRFGNDSMRSVFLTVDETGMVHSNTNLPENETPFFTYTSSSGSGTQQYPLFTNNDAIQIQVKVTTVLTASRQGLYAHITNGGMFGASNSFTGCILGMEPNNVGAVLYSAGPENISPSVNYASFSVNGYNTLVDATPLNASSLGYIVTELNNSIVATSNAITKQSKLFITR